LHYPTAAERGRENLESFEGFYLKNGSISGQSLAWTVLYVPAPLVSSTMFIEMHRSRTFQEAMPTVGSVDCPLSVYSRRHFVNPLSFSSFLLSSIELNAAKVYESSTRALLGTAANFCKVAFPMCGPTTSTVPQNLNNEP
jgi:hypothetical protein